MIGTIVSIATGAWKVVTGAVDTFIKNIGLYFAYKLGQKKAEAEANEETMRVKNEQNKVLSRPARHRSTLLKRMLARSRDEE